MSQKLFIASLDKSICVALLKGGDLIEFHTETENEESIVGNIYKGRVVNVLKGMQAAFVDIGRDKNAYLYLAESFSSDEELEPSGCSVLLSEIQIGDELMVQVAKVEVGNKGARVTTNISLPGRNLVFMPMVNYIGVSRKIEVEEVRQRLMDLCQKIKGDKYGLIVRTACKDAEQIDIEEEITGLIKKWEQIQVDYATTKLCDIVYQEQNLLLRVFRDIYNSDISEIYCDDVYTLERVREYLYSLDKNPTCKLSYFNEDYKDMFHYFGITRQIVGLVDDKVVLQNGGYLIIEETEALTVIDVNTGKYVGEENLESTVYQTNLMAAIEIAKQLRLRNIGGIVIVDFIDMKNELHRENVLNVLGDNLKCDRIKTHVAGMTNLGLVEITRKKLRMPTLRKISMPCASCLGKGHLINLSFMFTLIKVELNNLYMETKSTNFTVELSQQAMEYLFFNKSLSKEANTIWRGFRIYIVPIKGLAEGKYNITVVNDAVMSLPNNAKMLC